MARARYIAIALDLLYMGVVTVLVACGDGGADAPSDNAADPVQELRSIARASDLDADGKTTHEKIYGVAWGDAERRKPGAGGKLPPVGDTVDVARATWTNTIGDPDLTVAWSDPDFDPEQPAFHYVRVLEIPTPRWTAYDALRFGVKMTDDVPMKHQERAWTSPIWYAP